MVDARGSSWDCWSEYPYRRLDLSSQNGCWIPRIKMKEEVESEKRESGEREREKEKASYTAVYSLALEVMHYHFCLYSCWHSQNAAQCVGVGK